MNKPSNALIFTAGTGHYSLAKAISEVLKEQNFDVKLEIVSSKILNAYTPIYMLFPSLNAFPYKLSEYNKSKKLLSVVTNKIYASKIEKLIKQNKPKLIVSTWYLDTLVLDSLSKKYDFLYYNLITDPRTFSKFCYSPIAHNLCFDKLTALQIPAELTKSSFDNLLPVGWFVREAFEEKYDQKLVRQKLDIPKNNLTILVTAGSVGTNFILKILPTFLQYSNPLTVIFSCGNNKSLKAILDNTIRFHKHLPRSKHVILKTLTFTNDLHKYMQAADLVIGKAGPNQIFEAIATRTPYFAITHIAGQESGNLDMIREFNIGMVEENLIKANLLLRKILNQPNVLKQYSKPINTLARHNQRSKKLFSEHLSKQLDGLIAK